MVPLFSLSLPLLHPSSSLSRSFATASSTYPFSRPLSLSFSLFLSLAFSLSYRKPAVLSLEREPFDGRTKAAGCFSPLLLFCHSVLVSLRCSAREHSLPSSLTCLSLSLLVTRWLVHWFHRCTGPSFVFFLSNYTVTCNRPCQLAAPFFRSSSGALLFFFSRRTLRGVQPLRRDRREKRRRWRNWWGRKGRSSARDRTRQLILRIFRIRCVRATGRHS